MKLFSKKIKKVYFKPDFYYETTKDFCLHLGYDAQDVADLTGCSVQTARRWIKSTTPPPWLLPFLYATSGRILAPGFDGWLFLNKTVACPGWKFTLSASQIQSYTWHMRQLHRPAPIQAQKNPQQQVAGVIQLDKYRKKLL